MRGDSGFIHYPEAECECSPEHQREAAEAFTETVYGKVRNLAMREGWNDLPSPEEVLEALAAIFTAPQAERIAEALNPSLESSVEELD